MQGQAWGIPSNDCIWALLQSLFLELAASPSAFSAHLTLLRQSACSVKRELQEGLLCLSSLGDSLGVSPKHVLIIRGFLWEASPCQLP